MGAKEKGCRNRSCTPHDYNNHLSLFFPLLNFHSPAINRIILIEAFYFSTRGKHAVQHKASLPTKLQAQHEGERGDVPERKAALFKGENKSQRLGVPLLHIKV
jgi:hypothetical protein